MEIGLITDSVSHLPFETALDLAQEHGLNSVEVATGNWSEAPHADLDALVSSADARAEFAEKISTRGLTLSALNANGNQLHPVSGKAHDAVIRKTVELASALDVPTVVLMSGLPGAKGDTNPNWITTAWPPENLDVLAYQWNEVAIPYWKELAAFARDHNVKLAVEACGGQLVHSASAMLRLIDSAGADVVGANLDPSHLMWMGADIPTVIRALGTSIFHVHAKDIRINAWTAQRDGLLDTGPLTDPLGRAWNYVTLGLGHPDGATFWADFVYNLRAVGYDGTLNIEHEDALVNSLEGVGRAANLLKQVALVEAPDWSPAKI
ncbi:sugar phosphate isomerase/epimerase [Rhodococcus wratislaviensis]|uniref:Sugar phosphate isomerase/epimerase n=1 Tax=Rhodococcus wratislaviensis TaxID=44752 RepID=A0AB38FD44_RHOWR|nr:sugar phosphate isomerase/epimerase [Rhodococcus wratislaviensis]REE75601.1 sugar phosphate isomerase/epimerase [Rhodococcus wratislaviensis]SPZ39363.1 sugar phosphate isomerase/epimerase [Rhodococcus wratislaviensis]